MRASALVGGTDALLSGTTTLVDHHASPNAIDGALDVVADAFASLGARSVLCYETSDRDGPQRARAGLAENRRFAERVQREQPPLVRGMIGAHASFTLSDETLAACADAARRTPSGCTSMSAEDLADERDAVGALRECGSRSASPTPERWTRARSSPTACISTTTSSPSSTPSSASVIHNARSNMNNSIGRARVRDLEPRVALGTDGIGSDMFEESRTAYFRLREDDRTAGAEWPLLRLAESARIAAEAFGEPELGRLVPGAPADLVVLDYAAPAPVRDASFPGHWVFGLSSRTVRDVMVGGEWAVLDRRLTRVDQDELAALARVQAERLWTSLEEIGPHPFEPKGAPRWPSPLTSV